MKRKTDPGELYFSRKELHIHRKKLSDILSKFLQLGSDFRLVLSEQLRITEEIQEMICVSSGPAKELSGIAKELSGIECATPCVVSMECYGDNVAVLLPSGRIIGWTQTSPDPATQIKEFSVPEGHKAHKVVVGHDSTRAILESGYLFDLEKKQPEMLSRCGRKITSVTVAHLFYVAVCQTHRDSGVAIIKLDYRDVRLPFHLRKHAFQVGPVEYLVRVPFSITEVAILGHRDVFFLSTAGELIDSRLMVVAKDITRVHACDGLVTVITKEGKVMTRGNSDIDRCIGRTGMKEDFGYVILPGNSKITSVSQSERTTFMLSDDRCVFCFGDDFEIPTRIELLDGAACVCAGSSYVLGAFCDGIYLLSGAQSRYTLVKVVNLAP